MTPLPAVPAQPYDQATLDDVDLVLRDGAVNGHVAGVQALRRALDAQRALNALAQQFSWLVPPPEPVAGKAPPVRGSRRAPVVRERAPKCRHVDELRGPCTKDDHPRTPRLHSYATEVTTRRIEPEPTSGVPRVSFRQAG